MIEIIVKRTVALFQALLGFTMAFRQALYPTKLVPPHKGFICLHLQGYGQHSCTVIVCKSTISPSFQAPPGESLGFGRHQLMTSCFAAYTSTLCQEFASIKLSSTTLASNYRRKNRISVHLICKECEKISDSLSWLC